MPKMIPRIFDLNNNSSPGEKIFFERISRDEEIKNWVVLHSLNVAYHQTRVMGELDFIVIIPKLGILAIEIKSHLEIKVEDGVWHLGRTDKNGSISPFVQLNKTLFSLKNYITDQNIEFRDIPIFPLVIFTHCEFHPVSIEVHKNSYVSCKEFRNTRLSELLKNRIKKFREEISRKNNLSWLVESNRPDSNDMVRLIKILRPNIEPSIQLESNSSIIEKELFKFTSEQYEALDSLADHPCVLFNGAPGTGKTFIAVESAIRAAREGKKVLFVCMNKLLGDFLKNKLESWASIKVSTLHSLMRGYDFDVNTLNDNDEKYWNHLLPQIAYTNIINKSQDESYDLLIVDEAQDIIWNNLWLDCLDLLLKKGLTQGCWHIFGDFVYQNIYTKKLSESDFIKNLRDRNSGFVHFKLKKNCRNTEASTRVNLNILSMDSPYSGYLRKYPPILVSKYYMYSNQSEQLKKVNEIIQNCLKEGFHYSDIVILSKLAESKSLLHLHRDNINANLSVYDLDLNCLRYTSIHKFKGLEAPVIILTDFDEIESDDAKRMLFTGASRATDSVHYLFHKKVEKTLYLYLQRNK
ncbi:ATP-binding domain-containing protein [Acinetobacter sp. ANC 4282]|uniref:nuclease-related domain-containing DEAD/DEAH box helicase n=1 Tax=Acinetobacter terrae TaxID=2731247 RepID=UPI00148FB107|nr:NERD domain-containing protein [Acinetobacter terrae]NNH17075.1 ATP-binding domain-containing protein [Acinetobacter terrae]